MFPRSIESAGAGRPGGSALPLLLLLLLLVALPAAAEEPPAIELPAEQESGGLKGLLGSIGQRLGLGGGEETFLQPEQAFVPGVEVVDPYTLRASWEIADGYYLYRDKFSFEIEGEPGVTIASVDLPRGKEKNDEAFGLMEVFYHEALATLALEREEKGARELTLVVKFQGCADAGFCYPPMRQAIPVTLPAATQPPPERTAAAPAPGYVSEQDRLARSLGEQSIALSMLTFFGLGLLLTFTPCVFPMIPILSSIIAGQGERITTGRAFTLSLVYVLAMALTYTAAGVVAGYTGANLQAAFQNPWILGTFALVFVALSLSMFGFYELQMPARLQSRLTELSNRQRGGTLPGVAVMGFLSALIVGPCVAAPLAGALIYISQTGDAVLGGLALFSLSMGMGAPLLLIGTSAGKLLPKAGPWMDAIKAVFGVMLLAVAIWMVERIVPGPVALALWAALFIVSAIYLRALEPLQPEASGWSRLWKGLGVFLLVYGAILLLGAASGGRDLLRPLAGLNTPVAVAASGQTVAGHLQFRQIKGVAGLEQALEEARRNGQPVMLDFYADWCVSCKEMEAVTFSDPAVIAALDGVMLLQADVTANDEQDKALLQRFGLIGPPSILFFDSSGRELRPYRLVGFLGPEEFQQLVNSAIR